MSPAAPSSCRCSGFLWRRAVPGYACSLCHVNSAAIKEGQSEREALNTEDGTNTHWICDTTRWAGTNCPHLRVLNKLETSLNTLHSSEWWIIHDAFKTCTFVDAGGPDWEAFLQSELQERAAYDLCHAAMHTGALCVCVRASTSNQHWPITWSWYDPFYKM